MNDVSSCVNKEYDVGRRDLIDVEVSGIPRVSTTYHEFVQLMDDNVVSLIGLTVLLNNTRAQSLFREPITITQLTFSLYLLTKCHTRFRLQTHVDPETLSSLAYITNWIEVALKTIPADESVDHLLLKLAERQAVIYITDQLSQRKEESKLRQLEIALMLQRQTEIMKCPYL